MAKDRLISESRFVEDLYGCLDGCDFELEDVLRVLKGVESVDATPVVHGHWDDSYDGITPFCSVCHRTHNCLNRTPDYCPHCGSKMTVV